MSALNGPPPGAQPRLSSNQGASSPPFNASFKPEVNPWQFEYRDRADGISTSSHQKPIVRSPKFAEVAFSRQGRYITTSQNDITNPPNPPSTAAEREQVMMIPTSSHQLDSYKCLSGLSMAASHIESLAENSTAALSTTPQDPLYLGLSRSQPSDELHYKTKDFPKEETNTGTVFQHAPHMPQDVQNFVPQAHSMRSNTSVLANRASPIATPSTLAPPCNENHTAAQHGHYNNYFPPSSVCSTLPGFGLSPCKNANTPILSSQVLPIFSSDTSMGVLVGPETRYSPPTSMPMMLSSPKSSPPLASTLSSAFMLACSVSSAPPPLSSPPRPYIPSASSCSTPLPLSYADPSLARHNSANVTPVKLNLSSLPSSSGPRRKVNTGVIKKQNTVYVCHYPNCGRIFSRPFNLKSHGLTHDDVRPHQCDKCSKSFARVHDLHRHRRGHSPKSFACIVCQGTFARQDAVTRHLKIAEGMNHCGLLLRRHRIDVRDAAAGKVRRCVLGDESTIRRKLEEIEDLVRRARLRKNMSMRSMSANISTLGMNMNAVQQQQHQQHQYHRRSMISDSAVPKEE
ncbi:hypothetical protein BGX21_006099 [Mortierella sp. AD011]|nr:hypothetical protein BGX20_006124 [Mortierella sp. AD010]KAF9399526.1 hypothetical protein BGX21_006099 [Mortierella sp. AD011]